MPRKLKSHLPLLILTLIAFLLRIWNIESNPPSLNWDEVSHGYNAFSLLKTGKDEWGNTLPLIFRAFGDYKLPVYIYLTAIPVFFLGLTPLSVRLVSVLAGTLAIPGIYLLTNELFKNSKFKSLVFKLRTKNYELATGHIAAAMLAIMPWHFFISRAALEANLSLTLTIFTIYFLLKSIKNQQALLPASILAALSLHTYNTSRIFIPLLLAAFFFIYRPKIKLDRKLFTSGLILGLALAVIIYQVILGTGTARYQKLAILTDNTVFQIGQNRLNSDLPPLFARLRHNRPAFFAQEFTKNYLNYFSPRFTYQANGAQSQFAIPGKNLFSLPTLVLSFIGFLIIKKLKRNNRIFIFSLIFLSPVAAALTNSPPQALRPNPLIIPAVLLAAAGFIHVVNVFPKISWTKSAIAASLLISLSLGFYRYADSYHSDYKTEYSSSWQYGYQQAMNYVFEHQNEYDRVFITKYQGEPHIFYAFFNSLDPQKLQPATTNIRFQQSDWFWTDKIGEVYFVNDWDIPSFQDADSLTLESGSALPTENALLVASVAHLPSNVEIIQLIENPKGDIAFIIAEFK